MYPLDGDCKDLSEFICELFVSYYLFITLLYNLGRDPNLGVSQNRPKGFPNLGIHQ